MKTKRCPKCEQGLSIDAFGKNRSTKDGLQGYCRVCNKESCGNYHKRNRGKHNQRDREYYKQNRDKALQRGKEYYNTTVGHLRHVFDRMKQRCNNPNIHNYYRYGGRGIEIKFKSLDEFIEYVINELRVDPRGLQIDRIDNNGHYEKGNIRFVTAEVNNKNRRNIKVVA